MEGDRRQTKPWLAPSEQVEHLASKGVRFDLMSKQEAESYLAENNNYFRLRSYRNGFPKVDVGKRAGEYVNLDFKMLVDLSIIDMLLRYEMLLMTLDIEHFSKVKLLRCIEGNGEDGYEIVHDFICSLDKVRPDGSSGNRLKDEIERGLYSPYTSSLIEHYSDFEYPAWAFVEVITFGSFIRFYRFCAERFEDKDMRDDYYRLQSVKSLRNACAHNNCIINNLVSGKPAHQANQSVTQELSKIEVISKSSRKAKMSNDRIQQIITTLFVHRELASSGVHRHRAQSLGIFIERMNRHKGYYRGNDQVLSFFEFLENVVASWFAVGSERPMDIADI